MLDKVSVGSADRFKGAGDAAGCGQKLFFELRKLNRIDVCEEHIVGDHPERGYSFGEVLGLVKGQGVLQDTKDLQYRGERFYWRTNDIVGKRVRLVIQFERDEDGELILVISAGERV